MALYHANANGNLMSTTTWATVDSGALQYLETGVTALTTSFQPSTTPADPFTLTGTYDGVAVRIASITNPGSDTVTISLYNATDGVEVDSVTVNASDLPTCSSAVTTFSTSEGGWFFVKFGSSHALSSKSCYVRVKKTGSSSTINLWRYSATAAQWCRFVRTTSNPGSISAGDMFVVTAEWTAAATKTNRSVTMNDTGSTTFGPNDVTNAAVRPALAVGLGGTVTWSAGGIFKCQGDVTVYQGGDIEGTTGEIQLLCTSDGDFGFKNKSGTVNIADGPRTSGKVFTSTHFNGDVTGGASATANVADDTGWLSGDAIVLAGTTPNSATNEYKTLSGDAGATSITCNSTIANSRLGSYAQMTDANIGGGTRTQDRRAAIINLTRRFKISNGQTRNSGAMAYIYSGLNAKTTLDWVEVFNVGGTTTGKRGMEVEPTSAQAGGTGYFKFRHSSLHDCKNYGFTVPNTASSSVSTGAIDTTGSVAYNLGQSAGPGFNWLAKTTYTDITLDLVGILSANGYGISTYACGALITVELSEFGSVGAMTFGNNTASNYVPKLASGSSIKAYGGACGGWMTTQQGLSGTIAVNTFHTYSSAIGSCENQGSGTDIIVDPSFSSGDYWGPGMGGGSGNITHKNGFWAAESGITTTVISWQDAVDSLLQLDNMVVNPAHGSETGIVFNQQTYAISPGLPSNNPTNLRLLGRQSVLYGSGVPNQNILLRPGFVTWSYYNPSGGANDSQMYLGAGTLTRDTSFVQGGQGSSVRMTPLSASIKLRSARYPDGFRVECQAGVAVTVTAYARQSASGDGAAYNGNLPRLRVMADPMLGVAADATNDDAKTLATFTSASAGAFESKTGTVTPVSDGVLTFIVDCDGTAGWVNVNWSVSALGAASLGVPKWNNGLPLLIGAPPSLLSNNGMSGGLVA